MYPTQTSLIPVTVTLARFIETNGIASMFGHYPYWYLGVPFRYLSGPIIPLTLTLTHNLFNDVSLFSITIWFVLLSFIVGAIGWTLLLRVISEKKSIIHNSLARSAKLCLFVILLLLFPWRYLSALALDEASFVIARNFLPFVLLAFWGVLDKGNRVGKIVAIAAASFILLINTSILPILIVGVSGLVLARSFRNGKLKSVSKYIKPSLFIILASLFLVTFWYTPSYWWTILTNPSIGGASGVKVILRIFDLLRASVPLFLAIIAVYFSGKVKSRLSVFSLTWVFTFLFLTLFRFIGDPDFWQDWTSWLSEIEVGLALLASKVIYDLRFKIHEKRISKSYYLLIATLILPFFLTNYVYGLLHKPALISKEIPRGVRSLEKLVEIVEENCLPRPCNVFLSGAGVFWAGSTGSPLYQVRGGRDQLATHPTWDKAAYEFREGRSPEAAVGWLKELEIAYVLVHGPGSLEYYHDFKNIEKWSEIGEVVWRQSGDIIYKVN